MRRISRLEHQFVDVLPDEVSDGILYISLEFTTAAHRCCCGCGNQVITPLRPNRWRLTFDGESISLFPSVGNWNFPCKSHYWVEGSEVRWAPHMTAAEVQEIRDRTREGWVPPPAVKAPTTEQAEEHQPKAVGPGARFRRLLRRGRS